MSDEKITWSSFLKLMMTIAFPVALQNLLSTTAGMVDTIMIGSMGELAVAAVGICSQISSLFFSCYWGFAGGAMLFFAQYWGAKNERGINQTFGVTFLFMTVVGSVFAVTAITNPEFMLGIYTDKENIIRMGAPYIRIVGFAYPLQVFAVLVSFFMRATERVKAPLFCSVASLAVNFVLNFVLIYGRFGAPKMGVAGAAVGTLASGAVNLLLLVVFLLTSKCELRLRLREMFGFQKEFFGAYLSKCLPILANEMLYGVGQMIINIVIGHQDESAIAAMAAFRVCGQRDHRQRGRVRTFAQGIQLLSQVFHVLSYGDFRRGGGHDSAQRAYPGAFRSGRDGNDLRQIYAADLPGIRHHPHLQLYYERVLSRGWRGRVRYGTGGKLSVCYQRAGHVDRWYGIETAVSGSVCLCIYG